jgi:CheY-like chemotaxis protein
MEPRSIDTKTIQTQQELEHFATLIASKPHSWRGWGALRIEICGLNDIAQGDCLLWTLSIISSYLPRVQGHVYVCQGHNIHFMVYGAQKSLLMEAGQQICDLIFSESGFASDFMVYDLEQDALVYAQHVFDQSGKSFSVPVAKSADWSQDFSSHRQRVLLVEDDAVTRWMVRNTLKERCDFATAQNAARAYAMVPEFKPHLVFLDIGLPDQSGMEVLEWLKSYHPHTMVVMFSGLISFARISEMLEKGAEGFIAKPFMKENLLIYLHNVIQRRTPHGEFA